MMQVSYVPLEYVDTYWHAVAPHLEKSVKYTYGRYTLNAIYDSIVKYNNHLWAAYEDNLVYGAVVTEVVDYPLKRVLMMHFTGGVDLPKWKDPMLSLLRSWAKENECDCIESTGRPGWAKVFKNNGYKAICTTYELPLED